MDQALLAVLELMNKEHHHNAQDQCDKGGVEGDAEVLGDTGDVSLDGTMGLGEGCADAAYGADETDRGDRPGDIADGGELRIEAVAMALAALAYCRGGILNVEMTKYKLLHIGMCHQNAFNIFICTVDGAGLER